MSKIQDGPFGEEPNEERPDPLNPDLYRVSGPTTNVETGILAVPVRKPNKQSRPGPP